NAVTTASMASSSFLLLAPLARRRLGLEARWPACGMQSGFPAVTGPPAGIGGEWNTGRVTPEDLAHLCWARDLMDRDYAKPLDVPAMARQALMSSSHFSRQFCAAYGETSWSYLMTWRIERAMALLRRGDLSVTDVCMEVGCISLGSFSAR